MAAVRLQTFECLVLGGVYLDGNWHYSKRLIDMGTGVDNFLDNFLIFIVFSFCFVVNI